MNSAGSATEENEKVLNSITGKIQKLKSEFQQFASNMINSDFLKAIVDIGSGLLSIANTDFGKFVVQVGLATAAIVALNVALNKIKKSQYAQMFSDITKRIVLMGTSSGTTTFSVSTLAKSLLSMGKTALASLIPLATNPLVWIPAAIVGAIALGKAMDGVAEQTNKKFEEARDSYSESLDELSSLENKYDEISNKIEELEAKGSDRTDVEEATLDQYKYQLSELKAQLKELEKQTEERKKQLQYTAEQKAREDTAYSRKAKVEVDTSDGPTSGNTGEFTDNITTPNKKLSFTEHNNIVTDYEDDLKTLEKINQLIDEGNLEEGERKDLLEEQKAIIKSLKDYRQALLEASKLEGLTDEEKLDYYNQYLKITKEINSEENKNNSNDDGDYGFGKSVLSNSTLMDTTKTTGELSNQTETLGEALQEMAEDGEITADEVENLRDRYEDFDDLMSETGENVEDAAKSLTDYANSAEYAQSRVKDLDDIINSVVEGVGNYETNFGYLTTAVDEFNESGYITADTLKNITENDLVPYLSFVGGQLVANTNALYENADVTKYKALQDLQAAFNADALAIAEGNVSSASELAKTAVANAADEMDVAGSIAAAKAGSLFTFASGMEAINKAEKGEEWSTNQAEKEKQLQSLVDMYNKYGQMIANTDIAPSSSRTSKYTGSGGSSGSGSRGSSSSSKSEKEWWETEFDNLKDQFNYNEITIDQYINGLSNLLGRVQQGTEAWRKINEELQKQKLDKIEDAYDRGTISVKEYIAQLKNLQNAYKQGTEAWNELADKIKDGLKDLLEEQKDDYETAHDAAMTIIEEEMDKLDEQRDQVEEYYDKLIEEKEKANEETEKEIELAKLQEALYNAQNEKTKRIFREGIGWVIFCPAL